MFDPKTWQDPTPVVPQVPEVIQNLRKLSTLLREGELWEEDWRWDFGMIKARDVLSVKSCGFAGCALGLWDSYYSSSNGYEVDFLRLMIRDDFDSIFTRGPIYITPSVVADRIDNYITDRGF